MKIKVSLFIVALLIVFGMQMVSAQDGEYAYPVEGDYGYPIDIPTPQPLPCDEDSFSLYWNPDTHDFCKACPGYCAKQLPPSAHPAKEVVPNTPARQMLVAPANQIRRPLVIPVRNVLNNLFRFELVK